MTCLPWHSTTRKAQLNDLKLKPSDLRRIIEHTFPLLSAHCFLRRFALA